MAILAGLARNGAAVVPSDVTRFTPSAIFVGGAGTVVVEPEGAAGTTLTFTVPAGGHVLLACTQVRAASTATLMVRLSD
jgi:hypothetical protein